MTPTKILNAEVDVAICEPSTTSHQKRGKGSRREEEIEVDAPPPVEVHYQGDPEHPWPENWTAATVGEYNAGVAHINGDYNELVKLRKDLSKNEQADITSIYIAPIAMTIVGLEDAERDAPSGSDGQESELPDHFRKAALRSAALSSIFAIRFMHKRGTLLEGVEAEVAD